MQNATELDKLELIYLNVGARYGCMSCCVTMLATCYSYVHVFKKCCFFNSLKIQLVMRKELTMKMYQVLPLINISLLHVCIRSVCILVHKFVDHWNAVLFLVLVAYIYTYNLKHEAIRISLFM